MSDAESRRLAEAHVSWWLSSVRPLLIDNFIHGYKHGRETMLLEVPTPYLPGSFMSPDCPIPTDTARRPGGLDSAFDNPSPRPVPPREGPYGDEQLELSLELAGSGSPDLYRDGERSGDY